MKSVSNRRKYHRASKPPYTYIGLVALAIQSSSNKRMRLSEIVDRLGEMFPVMRSGNLGWRDSIRHNLSKSKCFQIDYQFHNQEAHAPCKGLHWIVNASEIPEDKFRRKTGNTGTCHLALGIEYVDDLRDVFDFRTGTVKINTNRFILTMETGIYPLLYHNVQHCGTASVNDVELKMTLYDLMNRILATRPIVRSEEQVVPSMAIANQPGTASYSNNVTNEVINYMIQKTPAPFAFDALVIICFKSLGVFITDDIVIAAQMQIVFPNWLHDNRVQSNGFTVLPNSAGTEQSYLVSNFLILEVRESYLRNPEIFTQPPGFQITGSFARCLNTNAIQPDNPIVFKTVSVEENELADCFIDSLNDLIHNIDLRNLCGIEIRRLMAKDDPISLQKWFAAY